MWMELLFPDTQKFLRLVIYRTADNRWMGVFGIILCEFPFVDLVTVRKCPRFK